VYTAAHILNRAQLRVNHDKTTYELWFGRPTLVKHFIVFGRKCYIKRDDDNLGKFDSRSDEGIFLGYSSNKNSYICYNPRLHKIVESENVKVDDLKSRRIKSQDNSQLDERRKNMMMKRKMKKYKKKNHKVKKKRKNPKDNIQNHHQEEYKKIILKVKS
jgi:hypothetical protein